MCFWFYWIWVDLVQVPTSVWQCPDSGLVDACIIFGWFCKCSFFCWWKYPRFITILSKGWNPHVQCDATYSAIWLDRHPRIVRNQLTTWHSRKMVIGSISMVLWLWRPLLLCVTYVCLIIHIHTYIYIYLYTHTYTYTHIHIYIYIYRYKYNIYRYKYNIYIY